jgi:DUF1680 family protein
MFKYNSPQLTAVRLQDGFLAPRQHTNGKVTIPAAVQQCRDTGRIDAFRLQWRPGMPRKPHIFWDSDFAKVLEGMALQLMIDPSPELASELDEYVDLVISAQQPDGYLNTYFTQVEPEKRWQRLSSNHELYCAGHLMEAAVAHFQATGQRKFLDCMCRYADYIDTVFGPGPKQKKGYPGHEEIELALCKLYDTTGEKRYLKLAEFFVRTRGQEPNYFQVEEGVAAERLPALQAHRPVAEQHTAEGHAVRAVYLYCAMADLAARTGDAALLAQCEEIWSNITEKRMYLTGGIGSTPIGERFTIDYHLPHDGYAESCAAIGLAFFTRRMLNLTGKRQYADVLERILYNGALSGISLIGDRFFYINRLESGIDTWERGETFAKERRPWFSCSCCPTSFCRFMPQLATFCWSCSEQELRLEIPAAGRAAFRNCQVEVQSQYPYNGKFRIIFHGQEQFTFSCRIPGWCPSATISLNGQRQEQEALQQNGYLSWNRLWQEGDELEVALDMPVEFVRADLRVSACRGRVAIRRGPLVYAVEGLDNAADPGALVLDLKSPWQPEPVPGLPEGTLGLRGQGWQECLPQDCGLYFSATPQWKQTSILAVPYSLWQNRGDTRMSVWLRSGNECCPAGII